MGDCPICVPLIIGFGVGLVAGWASEAVSIWRNEGFKALTKPESWLKIGINGWTWGLVGAATVFNPWVGIAAGGLLSFGADILKQRAEHNGRTGEKFKPDYEVRVGLVLVVF